MTVNEQSLNKGYENELEVEESVDSAEISKLEQALKSMENRKPERRDGINAELSSTHSLKLKRGFKLT